MKKITSPFCDEPIRFIQKGTDYKSHPVLMFKIGERPLHITSADGMLDVGLSFVDENDERVFFENRKMINERLRKTETGKVDCAFFDLMIQ